MNQFIFDLQIWWYRIFFLIAKQRSCFDCKHQQWESLGDGWNEPYGSEWYCSYQDTRQDLNDIYEFIFGEIDENFATICDQYSYVERTSDDY